MAFDICHAELVELVATLAKRLDTTEQLAIKRAVEAELARLASRADFDARLRELYKRFPKPEPTGLKADKAFFDDLSGEFIDLYRRLGAHCRSRTGSRGSVSHLPPLAG